MTDKRYHILAVDDEPLNLEILLHSLEKAGYEVTCSNNPEKALFLLHSNPEKFDIVLLDRLMPGMDGIELLKRIKAHEKLKDIPVIMQTAMSDKQSVEEGIASGAYYYLTKPFERDTLISIVTTAATDLEEGQKAAEELKRSIIVHDLVDECHLQVRTLEDAKRATTYIANFFPEPDRVSYGIFELVVNAIEHGNLNVGYRKKTKLVAESRWEAEVAQMLQQPEHANKRVYVHYKKHPDRAEITVQDQGSGFDWKPYMKIDPERAADNHGRGIALANMRCFDTLEYLAPGNKVIASIRL